jgi:hypothetical protein
MPRFLWMDVPLRRLEEKAALEVLLDEGCVVRGRVEGADGGPAAGIVVNARRQDRDPEPNSGHSVITEDDGTFELRGVPTIDAVLGFYEQGKGVLGTMGLRPRLVLPVRGQEGETVDLGVVRFDPPLSISGVVLDKSGTPARRGHVFALRPGVNESGAAENLGAGGRFEVRDLSRGRYSLKATIYEGSLLLDRGLEATIENVEAGATDVVIRVTGGGNLIVRFHSEGAPDRPLEVQDPSLCWGHFGGGGGGKRSEIRMVFKPGRREDLRVEAEGYKPKMLGPVEILPDRETIVDVVLEPVTPTKR